MHDDGMATAFRQQRLASAMALVVVVAYAVLAALMIASGGLVAGVAVMAVGAAGGIFLLGYAQMKAGVVQRAAALRAERSQARVTRVVAELLDTLDLQHGRTTLLALPDELEHRRPAPPLPLEVSLEAQSGAASAARAISS